jgi:pimeloyl-ACP methyl ester carboxylesterase
MRILRGLIVALLVLVLVGIAGSLIASTVLSNRNSAQDIALAALSSDEAVDVIQVPDQDWIIFNPTGPAPTTGYIIYPGGLVDPRAYAPLARDIAEEGFLVVIDPAPFNLAVADPNSANRIIDAFPEIAVWGIGGHSLGGAMAAQFIAGNPGRVAGLALYAAYPPADSDLSAAPIAATSIYGDNDGVATVEEVLEGANRLPADTVFVLIPGGNHTQFGSYGEGLQSGDNPAGISAEEQRRLTAEATVDMLLRLEN